MLFNKRIKEENRHPLKDKVARGIADFFLSVQSGFADFMSSKTNRLSIKAKWFWLAVYCVAFSGFSIYVFIGTSGGNKKVLEPSPVSFPKYYDQTEIEIKEPHVSKKDIKRINVFRKHMDSLRLSPAGKITYDSILKTRPGLMDSIRAIEQIYYSQSK